MALNMRLPFRFYWIFTLAVVGFLLMECRLWFFQAPGSSDSESYPAAIQGELDLRAFLKIHPSNLQNPSSETEVFSLMGEWEFYWETFLVSGSAKGDPRDRANISSDLGRPIATKNFEKEYPVTYLNTQNSWQSLRLGSENLPRSGYASYRMVVKIDSISGNEDNPTPLAIKIPHIASAYRFYCNGELLGGRGTVSADPEKSKPYLKHSYTTLPKFCTKEGTLDLVFEVSNYENDNPGFWQIPKLGTLSAIHRIQIQGIALDLFLFGTLVILGFYHWGIYFFHRSEKSILFFAIFSYLLAVRTIVTGERYILDLIPAMDWEFLFRVEFLSLFLLPWVFGIYLQNLFPRDSRPGVVRWIGILSMLFCVGIFFPLGILTRLSFPFLVFTSLVGIFYLYTNAVAVLRKRQDSLLFLVGVAILLGTVGWDIFQDLSNRRGLALTAFGFLGFVFTQALVLSSRLAANFTRTERLSKSLKNSNRELRSLKNDLEKKVEIRTKELSESLQLIHRDLGIAKTIQTKIIPDPSWSHPQLDIFHSYLPMNEVGGDVYDFFRIEPHRVRIFLADALGHGMQAALLTMAIKSQYESVKESAPSPRECLSQLAFEFEKNFSQLQTYFSCIIVDLDLQNNKLYFASAGHPAQILLDPQLTVTELTRTSHIIGLDKNFQVGEMVYPYLPGSRLFLFSDGLFEQFNENRCIMGEEELHRMFLEKSTNSPGNVEDIGRKILNEVWGYKRNQEQEDDILLIVMERKT